MALEITNPSGSLNFPMGGKPIQRLENLEDRERTPHFFYNEYCLNAEIQESRFIRMSRSECFYLLFSSEDEVDIQLPQKETINLKPFQSALFFDNDGKGLSIITAKKAGRIKISVICMVCKERPLDDYYGMLADFKRFFHQEMPLRQSFFIGSPIFEIFTKLERLSQLSTKNSISAKLMRQGLILEILGQKMEQIQERAKRQQVGILTHKELKLVKDLSKKIQENPSYGYTVTYLCRQSGLSSGKLQEGFKKLYNRTVIDYVREVRLKKAYELMQKSDLNISEIVYSIGFTSRSYFSKIFKQKYKCSPSQFLELQRRGFKIA